MNKMFRRFLATGAAVVLLATTAIPATAAAERFRDVPAGSWYYTAVDYAASEGLFSGTSANTFSPNTPMTRAMFVRVLGNKAGINAKDYPGSYFLDVPNGTWYTAYVQWAAGNGVVSGIGGRKFAPNQSVTREQMALILYNYLKTTGCDMSIQSGQLERFSDGHRVSNYAKRAMEWAISHKVIGGYGGRLDPQGTATRAQVAQIFYNIRGLLNGTEEENPSTPTPSPDPDTPRISITDEVRAKLKPNQDPEKLLDYVLNGKRDDPSFAYNGTTAQWDPTLCDSSDAAMNLYGSWENTEHEMRSSPVIANGFVQILTRTASDRFCITARDEDGCFCLYYHPADTTDSQKMREIKANIKLPGSKQYDSGLRYESTGWAGPMEWGAYNGAAGIAKKIEYYMTEMHPESKRYCITEPEPGVFYILYSYAE